MGLERAYAESCSDNSSIMRDVESLLTNAVKRFVVKHGHQDPLGKQPEAQASQVLQ